MAPLIHCIRHAQGFHNIDLKNLSLPDPILTPFGEEQCLAVAQSFTRHSNISLIIASPLIRTIQTALLCFKPALSNGHCAPRIIALPSAQETSDLVSDTGSDLPQLRTLCEKNNWPVDLSLLYDGWNVKTGKWAPTYDALSKRALDARVFIEQQIRSLQDGGVESPEIVFVTHGGYLHYLTEDWEDSGVERAYKQNLPNLVQWEMPGTAWKNTEVRTYTIEHNKSQVGSGPGLIETDESRERRGKVVLSKGQRVGIEAFAWALRQLEHPNPNVVDPVSAEGVERLVTCP